MLTQSDFFASALGALPNGRGQPSQRHLARLLAVTPAHVYKWLRGAKPGADVSVKIGVLLDVDARWIIAIFEHEHAETDADRAYWRELAERYQPDPFRLEVFHAHAVPELAA